MRKIFTLIAGLAVLASGLNAADITVTATDMDAAGNDVQWTADNTYILDGFVFVNDGQTLTIAPGTVVKGKPGQAELASALIVARGGKIMAEGTAEAPIIFTAEADDLAGGVADKARGLWGGVIVLGKGATNNIPAEKAIEGIPTSETRGLYGADPTVEDDNSGMMKYVSIRHGGTNIGEANEINGLTLGAVGSGTTFSYIEVVANADDGVEWFGGTPYCHHIVVAWCGDDSYDYDEGFSGKNQFMVAIQADDDGDRLGEHDGGPSSNQLGEPFAQPLFSNVTYVGRGSAAGKKTITFRDNAGGEYMNSIFAEQASGIDIEWRDDVGGETSGDPTGLCSFSQWKDEGILKIENNIFQNVADGTAPNLFKVASEKDSDDNELYTVPQSAKDDFAAYFATAGNQVSDVGVDAVNPTASGDVWGADFVGMDPWFSRVGYRGAFRPNENWAAGWTLSLGAVEAKENTTTGDVITVNDADIQSAGDEINWTAENTYILNGFVFVNDGQTLNIEAGTVIKGKPGQAELASALIVARGGKIMANGTADMPIIFTAEADDLEGSVNEKARGLWGGVIVLGKGQTNNIPAEKAIEGIPTSEPRGLYGADPTVEDDNSGMMKYVSIRHGGTNIGEANEINGLTLGAVGSGTTFSYIEVVANADDGVEWFGVNTLLRPHCGSLGRRRLL
jgi:urease beta subunit